MTKPASLSLARWPLAVAGITDPAFASSPALAYSPLSRYESMRERAGSAIIAATRARRGSCGSAISFVARCCRLRSEQRCARIGGCPVALAHAVVAHHGRDPQPVAGEYRVASLLLRGAVHRLAAPVANG